MDKKQCYSALENLNHSREQRALFVQLILNQEIRIPLLLDILEKKDHKHHYKAAWALEFACQTSLDILFPFLHPFLELLPHIQHDSALRPLAKVAELLVLAYYHQNHSQVQQLLDNKARQQLCEACFDWLITDQKVAVKAYAITCLFYLGQEFEWIHPELKIILEQDYPQQSPAFQSRAKKVLKKIS